MDAPVSRDRTTQVLTLHIILPTISGIFVSLRLYSRVKYLRGSLGLDDAFATFGWILAMALDVMICVETRYGLGRDLPVVLAENPDNLTTFLKYMFSSTFMYITASLCLKIGILFFYLRLSPERIFRTACFTLMVINVGIWIGCFGAGVFGCTPIRMYWDNTAAGHCINLNKLYLGNAILNITMDILTLCVPIPIVWMSPSMSTSKKLRITLLFGLGAFVCVASIIRIPTMFGPNVDANVTQNSVDSNRWTMIEVHLASIAAAIPAINALFAPAVNYLSGSGNATGGVGSGEKNSGDCNPHNKQRSFSGREKKGPRNGESILLETVVDDDARDPENLTTDWKAPEVEVAGSDRRSRVSVASNEQPTPEPQLGGWDGAGKAEAYSPPGYR